MKTTRTLRRLSILSLILALMLSMIPTCFAKEAADAVSNARNGVVKIFAIDPETGAGGVGTGFGIGTAGEETNYFVTNWHVITSSGNFAVGEMDIYILLTNDALKQAFDIDPNTGKLVQVGGTVDFSEMIKCEVVYSADQYPDVAILKAERKVPGRVALPLRSSRDVTAGSEVYALGYPAVADFSALEEEDLTAIAYADTESVHITSGVVSKLDDFELFGNTYCIEHDARISGGNSGGPLVDEDGNVIGINTYGYGSAIGDSFYNFSVFTDYAMDYLNQLGIAYDYVGMEKPFPVVPVAIGGAVVLALVIVLIVLKIKKAKRKIPVDTGLRVQFSPEAMMTNKRYVINGTLRFGRADDCNIQYEPKAPGISNHHCEILVDKGKIYIRDLNSSHGTFVNGSRIDSNKMIPLCLGSEVSLGGGQECFQIVKSSKK